MKPENRLQLMQYFGAKQQNTVWSWCAVNDEERKVYLSVWTDFRGKHEGNDKPSYIIQRPHWGISEEGSISKAGRKDHDEKLNKIFNEGYEAYGYFVEAKDIKSVPREIAKTITSFVMKLELKRLEDGTVIGYPLNRIEVR